MPSNKNDMWQLWNIHVFFTREVIIARAQNAGNLSSSLNALLQNQKDLGDNLAKYTNRRTGEKYADLLTIHINQAVKIVDEVIRGIDPKNTIKEWYENAEDISKLLHKSLGLNLKKISDLFDKHLDCTLDEANAIIQRRYEDSNVEFYKCLDITSHLAKYILKYANDNSCCDDHHDC